MHEGEHLQTVTPTRVLRFVVMNIELVPAIMSQRLGNLRLGVYKTIATVLPDQSVMHAMNILEERQISTLPVVDPMGVVVDTFSKLDVTALAMNGSGVTFDSSVGQVCALRAPRVFTYSIEDPLSDVLLNFTRTHTHALICVDGRGGVKGMLTLGDVLKYFIGVDLNRQ